MTSAALPLLEVDLGAGVLAGYTAAWPEGARQATDDDGLRAFNLSRVLGDDDDAVLARRAAVREWAGRPVVYARQVHGSAVHVCLAPPPADRLDEPVADADAMLTTSGEVAVAVLVADCVPVLLADPSAPVVAAVHAGRRGLVDGVVQGAVDAMVRLGAQPDRIRGSVGPAICGACYEVPAAMQREVAARVPATAATTSWGTPGLDLPAGVTEALRSAGVRQVIRTGGCTFTDERLFSHRASGAAGRPQGRFAAVVALGRGAG